MATARRSAHRSGSPALPRFDFANSVVLCGAGISIEAPSSLPDGGELALMLLDFVTGGKSDPFSADAIARLRREIRSGELRLEVICDLIANELPLAVVTSVFALLRNSPPNRVHLSLAQLAPVCIVTTNQDVLIEVAAAQLGRSLTVIHLHGRCDRPKTISTTVRDYLHGLSPRLAQELRRAVDGRDVVVVGYSGRDLDVMGCLAACSPRRVVWIEHGSRSPVSALPPEVMRVERSFAARWTRVGRETGDWLFNRLSPTERAEVKRVLAAGAALPASDFARPRRRLSHRFARLDAAPRALAVGRVLQHAGMQGEAQSGYRLLRTANPTDARVGLAWAEATFELNEFASAIRAFRQVRRSGAAPGLVARAVVGEVEALRDMSRFNDARSALKRLWPVATNIAEPVERARMSAAGYGQLGGMTRMDGDLSAAETAYRDAERASLLAGDIRHAIESRTWRTEILLARGRYRDALLEAESTQAYEPLTNARWLTWARFTYAEALCAAGETLKGLDVFRRAVDEFSSYGNPQGEAWTLIAEASFVRSSDPIGAGHSLSAAREAIASYGGTLAYAEARLLWEEAELARTQAERAAARRLLGRYRAHVQHHFPHGHVWLELHGSALEVELAREARRVRAEAMAEQIAVRYEAIGAKGAARRMSLSAWAAAGMPGGPGFAKSWATDGCFLEVSALREFQSRGTAPLNIWFVP